MCSDLVRCQPAQCAALGCCISISIIFVASYFMASRMSTSIVLISNQFQDGPKCRFYYKMVTSANLTDNLSWTIRDSNPCLTQLSFDYQQQTDCGVLWNRTIVTGLSNLHPKPLNELPKNKENHISLSCFWPETLCDFIQPALTSRTCLRHVCPFFLILRAWRDSNPHHTPWQGGIVNHSTTGP